MKEDMWLHAAFSERMDTTTERSGATIPPHIDKSTETDTLEAPNRWVHDNFHLGCEMTFHKFSSGSSSNQDRTGYFSFIRLVSAPSSSQRIHFHGSHRSSPALCIDKGKGPENLILEGEDPRQKISDPLEEFYAEAREARENGVSGIDNSRMKYLRFKW
jgi:hypothetical protein